MRRLLLISLICLWGATALGQQETPPWQPEVEQRAREVLNGRSVVARVYLNPRTDPERFSKASIPVAEGRVKLGAVKSACPSITDSAVVFIWSRDQTDPAVADVLSRHVYMSRYFEKFELPLRFLAVCNDYSPQWTFLDARGEPIPRASVKVAACGYDGTDDIPLYTATLDEQGRLPRLLGTTFVFTVEHPNYGIATVLYMNQQDDPCGIYVVPLVPRDSQAFAVSAQGNVIDSDGNPVAGATVTCEGVVRPDGAREQPYQRILSRVVTDAKGWFALCMPTVTKDFELTDLPPAGSLYYVAIEPPTASNLRRPDDHSLIPVTVIAGSRQTFTLQRMDSEEYFHMFTFEYQEGPITSVEELKNVKLTLVRDGREWRHLTYEQWKDGCSLPLGVLRATTTRWGGSFGFPNTELTADSPTHLEIKAGPLTMYRGKVIDAATGEALPGAFVLAGYPNDRKDPCSLTDDQWRQLRTMAAQQAADRSSRALYEWHNRVAVTDANGAWEMAFMPGFNESLYGFTALAPGYKRGPAFGGSLRPPADGFAEVATIKLSPRNGQSYFPTFIFETETGPVTDPAKLNQVRLELRGSDGSTRVQPYEAFVSERQFTPGVYSAEVTWDRKYYTFEPVDLSRDRPETVTFRPAKIEKVDVVYEGTVLHGVTDRPMAGVIVLHRRRPTNRDASSVTAEQWAAIGTLGPQMDPNDPALAPLLNILVHSGIPVAEEVPHLTRTDSSGRFTLSSELGPPNPTEELLAVAHDFLGARQRLTLMIRPEGTTSGPPQLHRLEADSRGIVSLPPLRLFPAATVSIQPVLSDPGYQNPGQSIRFYWRPSGDDHLSWVKDLLGAGRDGLGGGVFYQYDVQPNIAQTVYVPAGVRLDLAVYLFRPMPAPFPPVRVTNVTLEQGQIADLGRLELKPGVEVTVRAVDRAGHPVADVRIDCVYDDGFQSLIKAITDAQGVATLSVPARSAGRFRIIHYDRQTQTASEESTAYTVAGDEDAGKEFTLQLSDAFVRQIRDSIEAARRSLPAMPPASRQR